MIEAEELQLFLPAGRLCALVCDDAAARTNLLDRLAGCAPAKGWTIRIAGMDLAKRPVHARASLGYCPAKPPLYPEMRLVSFLRFVARARGLTAREGRRLADEALERLGLAGARSQRAGLLSEAQKARANLAQAILHHPEALLLDDPTRHLSPVEAKALGETIRALAPGRAVLWATSSPDEALSADKLIRYEEGQILQGGANGRRLPGEGA